MKAQEDFELRDDDKRLRIQGYVEYFQDFAKWVVGKNRHLNLITAKAMARKVRQERIEYGIYEVF